MLKWLRRWRGGVGQGFARTGTKETRGCKVASTIVLHCGPITDGRLAFGDAIEVAHGRGLCSDGPLWQCDQKSCPGFDAAASGYGG